MAKGAVPAFHVIELPAVFADLLMGLGRQDFLISFPKVAEAGTGSIFYWDAAPQMSAGVGTAVTQGKGNDLPSSPTHDGPQPAFILPQGYKRPHFIVFEDVVRFSWQQGRF